MRKLKFPTHLRKMWSGSEVQAWIDEHLAEQAEQEPVGNISLWHNHGYQNHNVEYYGTLPVGSHNLYAAPVRTKDPCNPLQDLTDDEIEMIFKSHIGKQYDDFARAVIAAYKEKNK